MSVEADSALAGLRPFKGWWIEPWLPLLREGPPGRVLELGCGSGHDAIALADAGFDVVGIDHIPHVWPSAGPRPTGKVQFAVRSLHQPWPINAPAAVIASLSLHFFDEPTTGALVDRIHASVARGGILLARLNSTRDIHYGARGHPRVGENLYLVGGQLKRFFDEATIRSTFARGWQLVSLREGLLERPGRLPKALWEVVLRHG